MNFVGCCAFVVVTMFVDKLVIKHAPRFLNGGMRTHRVGVTAVITLLRPLVVLNNITLSYFLFTRCPRFITNRNN